MDRQTCGDNGVAFVKKLRYRSANVNTTGSCISMVTASSSLSTLALCASFILPSHSKQHHHKNMPADSFLGTTLSSAGIKHGQGIQTRLSVCPRSKRKTT